MFHVGGIHHGNFIRQTEHIIQAKHHVQIWLLWNHDINTWILLTLHLLAISIGVYHLVDHHHRRVNISNIGDPRVVDVRPQLCARRAETIKLRRVLLTYTHTHTLTLTLTHAHSLTHCTYASFHIPESISRSYRLSRCISRYDLATGWGDEHTYIHTS